MNVSKILAVVVTFNRLDLLKRTIDSLRKQSIKLNGIVVVNNGSTDGTVQWLDSQVDLCVIHQENVGGSGGFYTGINKAYDLGAEWIWCMDDDVYPKTDCLEQLLVENRENVGILCPLRNMNDKPFACEVLKLNLSNPFKYLHEKELTPDDICSDAPLEIMGMAFEGPLIKREVVKKIGLPNKDLFLFFDDTDYTYRTILAGYKVLLIPKATLYKEYFFDNMSKKEMIQKKKWKVAYNIRNQAYFCHHYGKNFWFRHFGPYRMLSWYVAAILFNLPRNDKYTWKDLMTVFRMQCRGVKEILGKM